MVQFLSLFSDKKFPVRLGMELLCKPLCSLQKIRASLELGRSVAENSLYFPG
jgi:hypothetical protein